MILLRLFRGICTQKETAVFLLAVAAFTGCGVNFKVDAGARRALALTSSTSVTSPSPSPSPSIPEPDRLAVEIVGSPLLSTTGCLPIKISSRDTSTQELATSSLLSVALSASPTVGSGFYSDSGCTTPITSASIAASTSSTSVYFKRGTAGAVTLNATDNPLNPGSLTMTLAAPPTGLSFSPSTLTLVVSQAMSSVTSTLVTGLANTCSSAPSLPSGLTVTASGGNCILSGTPAATSALQTYTITATNPLGSTTASIGIQVVTSLPDHLALALNGTPLLNTTQCLPLDLTTLDSSNLPSNVISATAISLTSSPSGGSFYSDSSCSTGITQLTLAAGTSSGTVYFKRGTAGAVALTASQASLTQAVLNLTLYVAPTGLAFTPSSYSLLVGTVMTSSTSTLTAGVATSCSSTPSLPVGLSIAASSGNCVISGTPTHYAPSTSYTITASNPGGLTTFDIQIFVDVNTPILGVTAYHSCSMNPLSGNATCKGGNKLLYPNVLIGVSSTQQTLTGVSTLLPSTVSNSQCALLSSGEVRCWGYTGSYLGTGVNGTGYETLAVPVMNIDGTANMGASSAVVSASTGYLSACFATADGYAYCTGDNTYGELGNASTATGTYIPVQVKNSAGTGPLTNVVEVSVGYGFACARITDGTVYCWGKNDLWQAAPGNTATAINLPVQIVSGATSIGLGYNSGCAVINAAGNLACWGGNDGGRLGNNIWNWTSAGSKLGPNQVKGNTCSNNDDSTCTSVSGYVKVVMGRYHSCATRTDGGVDCWGTSTVGQMGNGGGGQLIPSPVRRPSPNQAAALSGVTLLASGYAHICAQSTSDGLVCWGGNATNYGQLGDNTKTNRSLPVKVLGTGAAAPLTGATSISASYNNTCALVSGSVYCWGNDFYGQTGQGTGQGTLDFTVTPGPVKTWDTIASVSAPLADVSLSDGFVCYLASGNLTCFGEGGYGQMGNGISNTRAAASQVLDSSGTAALSNVVKIKSSTYHICALLSDQTVNCWGRNAYGAIGDGTTTDRNRPTQVKNPAGTGALTGIVDIAVGLYHSCALSSTGGVYCWGGFATNYGQIGDGASTNRSLPVAVKDSSGTASLTGISSIALGSYFSCALTSDGKTYCWGLNTANQLGDSTATNRSLPTAVQSGGSALTGATAISIGYGHSCALKSDRTMACWGGNTYGQVGNATNINQASAVAVVGTGGTGALSDIAKIALGKYHSCAVNASNQTYCWGSNWNGQLGLNSGMDSDMHNTPLLTGF